MRILYFLFLGLIWIQSVGQKKVIDQAACNKFERLQEVNGRACLLSANGNFVLYEKRAGDQTPVTVLKNIKTGAEKRFRETYNEVSFDNERMFAFQFGDSTAVFDTENGTCAYLIGVRENFVIVPSKTEDRILYFKGDPEKKFLIISNSKGEKVKELPGVNRYWLHKGGERLLINGAAGLTYINLKTFRKIPLAPEPNVEDAAFNTKGDEVAYLVNTREGTELRYANLQSGARLALLGSTSDFLKDKWQLQSYGLSFDNGYGNVFFKVSPNAQKASGPVITKDVNVWSYQDRSLQQKQIIDLRSPASFTSMINVKSRRAVLLESDTLKLAYSGNTEKFFILTTQVNDYEFYWNQEKMSLYLFSSSTGKKQLIRESEFPGLRVIGISPSSKFLVWFDGRDGNYYSYAIESSKITNISRFTDESLRAMTQRNESSGLIIDSNTQLGQYWADSNTALIVHAKNDIWQLDLAGIKKPVNLTGGYGFENDITFRLLESDGPPLAINKGEHLAFALNNHTKQNGFWKIAAGKSSGPIKLVMSNDAYYFYPTAPMVSANAAENPSAFRPVKALASDLFVVRKMNSFDVPNLYVTSDFKNFRQLSDIKPDTQYVHVKTKLVSYVLPDGQTAEGILHLPDNLDVRKKYPVIFNYYERRSEGLNVYRTQELSGHNINIPWYVSRGYLVFEPDFYYKRGETAQSVINCVGASLAELTKLPYVDTARMGAQGQSFGGYESNVLAIQSTLFKAVCAMAGPTNIISEYGSIRPGGHNNQNSSDVGQRNLGVFPWQYPEVFIANSPVFHINKAKTPLLLVHNRNDDSILFPQAMELYLGMRRTNKKVWLLEYDREEHEINDARNKLDFTIRMQQFFDHYLKGEPAPKWMTRGISAKMKGIDSGLELDSEIKTPGEGIARPVAAGKIF